MNHLAHLFLSRHSEKMMVGNFIADGVKGKRYLQYEEEISRGIVMHREIDTFTDSHPLVSHSKSFFRRRYGLFSAVLVDLFYDHFLAKNFDSYSSEPLLSFADKTYAVLEKFISVMPERYQRMFPYMRAENWLLGYAEREGIQRSLNGMSMRIKNHPGIQYSMTELAENYKQVEEDFKEFFPLLEEHVKF